MNLRLAGSHSVSYRVAVFFAVVLATVSLLAIVMPIALKSPLVEAQADSDGISKPLPDDEPTLRWVQGSSDVDSAEFYGAAYFGGNAGRQFAGEFLAAMEVDSADVAFDRPSDFFDDGIELAATFDDHWLTESKGWRGSINVQQMAQAARSRGFTHFGLEVCPLIGADIQYALEPDSDFDDCKGWSFDARSAMQNGGVLTLTESPDKSFYNSLLLYFVAVSVVFSALLGALTVWLRRKYLPTLGGGNLALSAASVFIGATAITTTLGVFLVGVGSVDDVIILDEGGWRQHAWLVLAPSFLTAMPFLLSSILIVMAKPRPLTADRPAAVGGVPYWMVSQQPAAAPTQSPPTQSWAPPPQESPPQPPAAPPQPNHWDPPA